MIMKSSFYRMRIGFFILNCIKAIAAASIILLTLGQAAADSSKVYKLGPQDKLRLRIYEWRAPIDKVYEWTAMNGEFVVGVSGMISLPLIGDVLAEGRTTSELAEVIGKQMVEEIKLRWPPKVALEVSEYRPFFIVGAVAKPGGYPYQPNLTVLRALSIAGGLPRPADNGFLRLGREVISGHGSVKQLASKTKELLARKARLEAEQKQADKLVFPKELTDRKDDSELARILHQEENIFMARRIALKTQVHTLTRLKEYLNNEVLSLQEQVKLKQDEIDTVNQELGNVITLVKKGLTPTNRQFSLERLTAQISSDKLRLETALLKAKQEISRTDVAIDEARNNSAIEIASALRTTEAELEQTGVEYTTQEKLLYESEVIFPNLLSARRQKSEQDKPKYTIIRNAGGKPEEIDASESSTVLPGDTIKVELPIHDDLSSVLRPPPRATQ
jgi:polysaccharide export outer membrane protein/exopolysaccharide production protein ExoF